MKIHHTHLFSLAKLTLFCLSLLLLLPIQSHAKDVSFEWAANPEPLTGYKLHYNVGENSAPPYEGTGINEGDSPISTGKVTTYTVTGLSPNEIYHFVITAYNDAEESEYSTIITIQPDSFPSPTINTMSQN